jgi:hypothetical protein
MPANPEKGALTCLRCKTVPLQVLPGSSPEVEFLECPACERNFAKKIDKDLTFRWLHPISLVLYRVLFSTSPVAQAEEITAQFTEHWSREEITLALEEIRLELNDPTQQVSDILDNPSSEEKCREYLRLVAEIFERNLSS